MDYYRFTNKTTPMSDWGHAMFAENRDMVCCCYGRNEYTYDGRQAVAIATLYDVIAAEWEASVEHGMVPDAYADFDAETVCKAFNPGDIVMSAEAWDDDFMLEWFCEHIAIKYNILAVTTNDGAIIFDACLATAA